MNKSNKRQAETFNPLHNENDKFINEKKLEQKKLLKQQDAQLNILEKHLDNINNIAYHINDEIKDQTLEIDGLESDIEKGNRHMNKNNNMLNKFIKDSSNSHTFWVIAILIIILIILVCLVIWT